MRKSNFNSQLRSCISEMYKKGTKLEHISGYPLSEDASNILYELYQLIMETDYYKKDTIMFLINKYGTYRAQYDNEFCSKNKNTSRSRITYDLSKLKKLLGEDALDIIIKKQDTDLSRYKEIIHGLLEKHRNKSILDGFTINLPKYGEVNDSLTEDELNILMDIASSHSRNSKRLAEMRMTKRMLGYMQYLEKNKDSLTEGENNYYEDLKAWLVEELYWYSKETDV